MAYPATIGNIRVIGRQADCLKYYEDYYFSATRKLTLGFVGRREAFTRVTLIPGQKGKLLRAISEDIINDLETLIKEYSDIYYDYEIIDDFRRIAVYVSDITEARKCYNELNYNIHDKSALYRNIRLGRLEGIGTLNPDGGLNFVIG